MLADGNPISHKTTRRSSAVRSKLMKTTALSGLLLLCAVPSAEAYYRPPFVAVRPMVSVPAFRPAMRPIVRMPAPRPIAVPVYRPAVRPVITSVMRPAVHPPAPPPYRPANVAAAPRVQPAVQPPALPARPAPATTARPTISPVLARPSSAPVPSAAAIAPRPPALTVSRPPATPVQTVRPPMSPAISTATAQSTPAVVAPSPLATKVATVAAAGVATAAQFPQTRPGQVITESLAAAGGEVLKSTPLSLSTDAVGIANAYLKAPNRTDGLLAAGSQLSGDVAVEIAGKLGGPVAAAGTQALVTAGDVYVAPALGNAIYNAAPGLFTPASQARVNILAAPGPTQPLTAQEMNGLLVLK
jgi:hypothetical protein